MPCLAKPWVSHTSSYEALTSLWAAKIFPKPVNFTRPQLWVMWLGGRVQLGVERAESISVLLFTLFEPHLVFVSAADTSSERHPSLLD